MKLYIASDHCGFELKNYLKEKLLKLGYLIEDLGPFFYDKSDDYPDFAAKLILKVAENENSFGILICKSGIGMSIIANKHPKTRAALCISEDIARKSRKHNNVNILCLGSDYVSKNKALKIVKIFLKTGFEGGRHRRRMKKIEKYAQSFR